MSPILGIFASQGRVASSSYDSIQTVTVGAGGQAAIDFTSIPSTYKHLQIRAFARTNRANSLDAFRLQFNGDTGSNYYFGHYLFGTGASASAGNEGAGTAIGVWRIAGDSATSGVFGTVVVDLLDYTSTNKNKTVRYLGGMDNNGSGEIYIGSGFWFNSTIAAISSIKIVPNIGTSFNQNTQFALYGIK